MNLAQHDIEFNKIFYNLPEYFQDQQKEHNRNHTLC
jgi:hypothetical protein